MAKLSKGILGGISGKVGNVIGGRWRGIDYIRSKPSSVKNPKTEAQETQRMRFRLVMGLLKKSRLFINIGFKGGSQGQTAMNRAMSLNVREAITGTYPDLEIDPEAFVVSIGDLQGATTAGMDLSVAGTSTVTWVNEAGAGNASNEDAAMVLLYNMAKGAVVYSLYGASREDETLELNLPGSWSGDPVAGYLAFRSETGSGVSDGIYLGTDNAA